MVTLTWNVFLLEKILKFGDFLLLCTDLFCIGNPVKYYVVANKSHENRPALGELCTANISARYNTYYVRTARSTAQLLTI
jgi:hypothetical protein